MSGVSSDPKAMEAKEDEISNGLSEPMDVDETKTNKPVAELSQPGKITRRSRKSSSSVSSEKSTSKENGDQTEVKSIKHDSSNDDEDFPGFSLPIDGTAREKFLQFLKGEKDPVKIEDDGESQSDKMSVENADSDVESGTEPKPEIDAAENAAATNSESSTTSSTRKSNTAQKSSETKTVQAKKSLLDIDKNEFKKPFEFELNIQEEVKTHTPSHNPGGGADTNDYIMETSMQRSQQDLQQKRMYLYEIDTPASTYGWVREVVSRTSTTDGRSRSDVYYYTPGGKKVRSTREIIEYLTGDLTIANFTFMKEPLGINDPKKEIVRQAENRVLRSGEDSSSPQQKKGTPTSKPKTKGGFDQVKSSTPKVAFKFVNKKLASGKKPDKARKSISGTEVEDDSSEDTDWDMVQKNPTREVCSIECRLAMGLIPTLQCVSCLCLYHPECVGVQQDKLSSSKPYSCKNCQGISGQQPSNTKTNNVPPPPPLIPLSPQNTSGIPTRKSVSKTDSKTNTSRQNIVGTVTTWLSSSSSIQVSQSSPTSKTSTTSTTMSVAPTTSAKPAVSEGPHQGLLEIGSNAFVVVPRHNVVNVSNQTSAAPATATTANNLNPSQTQTNGILLVPLSVQPPDSTLADSSPASNSIRTVNPGVVAAATNSETNGLKRVSDSSLDEDAPPPKKISMKVREVSSKNLPNNFFSMGSAVTSSMHCFFQYLKVHELLRATQVNKTWHFIATHQSLWETVRMKNSKVRDFEGFGNALRKYNTKSLDLRKMITPESSEATTEMWSRLASVISTLPNLRRVDFGRCAPSAIEVVAAACPHLESITSLSIRGNDLNLSPIVNCSNLVELKLKSFGGIDIKNLSLLKQLPNLKSLYLTSVKNLEGIDQALPETLENLELGECVKLPERFAVCALPKLVHLKRLRLERGGTGCPTLPILQTIATLPNLSQLELINFDIKPGFDKALSKCTNIKILLIIPTYVTQSATTNHVVMGGVSKLSGSLQYFIWGLTLELLRVTDLFIDQVEGGKSKSGGPTGKKAGAGDSIPILKPLSEENSDASREGSASQVDILGLPKLQRVLSTLLPQTKIKILKIPVSATWRQTVTDVPV